MDSTIILLSKQYNMTWNEKYYKSGVKCKWKKTKKKKLCLLINLLYYKGKTAHHVSET